MSTVAMRHWIHTVQPSTQGSSVNRFFQYLNDHACLLLCYLVEYMWRVLPSVSVVIFVLQEAVVIVWLCKRLQHHTVSLLVCCWWQSASSFAIS